MNGAGARTHPGTVLLSVRLIYFTLHVVFLYQHFNGWYVELNTTCDGDAVQLPKLRHFRALCEHNLCIQGQKPHLQ